jgi:hypothetical protein
MASQNFLVVNKVYVPTKKKKFKNFMIWAGLVSVTSCKKNFHKNFYMKIWTRPKMKIFQKFFFSYSVNFIYHQKITRNGKSIFETY